LTNRQTVKTIAITVLSKAIAQ